MPFLCYLQEMKDPRTSRHFTPSFVRFAAGVFSSWLLLSLAACNVSPETIPEEDRIPRADAWFLGKNQVPRCGPPVREEDILIVDLEALDYDAESLEREVGPFTQVTDSPVAVSGEGSGAEVVQRVLGAAAGQGCDVVLLGPMQTRTEYYGGTAMSPGPTGKREAPYQLFRMGYRAD
jgi:hypothetical protein